MQFHRQKVSAADRGAGSWRLVQRLVCGVALLLGTSILSTASARGQIPTDDETIRTNDLVRLATSYADAMGELKIATMRVETLTALRQSIVVTNMEIEVAKIQRQTAQNKILILRAIVEKELAAAKARLTMLKQLEAAAAKLAPGETATVPAATRPAWRAIADVEATIKVLEMILALE